MKAVHFFYLLSAGLALAGHTSVKFMGNDALAAEGFTKLMFHVAKRGIPSPGTCTLEKLSVRREW
jgi:tyrosinase